MAYINRGRLAETGTLWNDTGELVLAENHYDELATLPGPRNGMKTANSSPNALKWTPH